MKRVFGLFAAAGLSCLVGFAPAVEAPALPLPRTAGEGRPVDLDPLRPGFQASLTTTFTTSGTAARAGSLTGGDTWGTTNNALASDGAKAIYGLGSPHPWAGYTFYLTCTELTDEVPAGATIDGVTAKVERRRDAADPAEAWKDSAVFLIKGGTIQTGTNKATATAYTTSDVTEDHGGAADLWGIALTDTDVNGSGFGIAFSALASGGDGESISTVEVDAITVTINYTLAVPVYDQDSFRVMYDDGSESGATFVAAANTDVSLRPGVRFRLRVLVQCTVAGGTFTPNLYYRVNTGGGYGAWATVFTSGAIVNRVNSPNVSSGGNDTTQRLGAGTFIANNNGVVDASVPSVMTSEASKEWEYDVVLCIDRTASKRGDLVQLKMTNDGVDLDTYTNTVTVTVLPDPSSGITTTGGGELRRAA